MDTKFISEKESMKALIMLTNEPIEEREKVCRIIDESNTKEEFIQKTLSYIEKFTHVVVKHVHI
jgi:hypothetical protein